MRERKITLRKGIFKRKVLSLDGIAEHFFEGRIDMANFFLESTTNQRARYKEEDGRSYATFIIARGGLDGHWVKETNPCYVLSARLASDNQIWIEWYNVNRKGPYVRNVYGLRWGRKRQCEGLVDSAGSSINMPFNKFRALVENH